MSVAKLCDIVLGWTSNTEKALWFAQELDSFVRSEDSPVRGMVQFVDGHMRLKDYQSMLLCDELMVEILFKIEALLHQLDST